MTAPHGLAEAGPRSTRDILRATLPLWLALMLLLAATLGLAYVPLGRWSAAVAFGISGVKTVLIGVFFMKLRDAIPLVRIAACAAMLWLAFLFLLTFADLLTRAPLTQPGTIVPSMC